jgi:predicted DNA-binding protein|tara:strand:+ start:457 stop:606 length:150 start_codon:yes stop_codon:yes gene_type:complete
MIRENDYFLAIRIPDDLRRELQRLADNDNRKLADYARLVLVYHVKEQQK